MQNKLGIAVLGLLVAVTLVSVLRAQEGERKTESIPPARAVASDASFLWNFHFAGKKKKGDVIELVQLDDAKYSGKALVVTHLGLRLSQSMRMELQEYRQDAAKKAWAKTVRRGEAFSAGMLDHTNSWILADYDSRSGIVFEAGTRPSLELTFGSGDLEVWAEGYWALK